MWLNNQLGVHITMLWKINRVMELVVEQSVKETDYYSLEGWLCAAAYMGEQSIPDIDYIPLANQMNAATDTVHQ